MPDFKEPDGSHLIGGEWICAESSSFSARNALTGEELSPVFSEAGGIEVEAAMSAARSAFDLSRSIPGERMAALLEDIADGCEREQISLTARAGLETGLLEARLKGEIARTIGQLKLFARVAREHSWVDAVIDHPDMARKPAPKPDIRRIMRPIGPIIVFDASNFPFAFGACGGDTASALAVGCPVVVKAHPAHPGTDSLFASIVLESLYRTDMPLGMFSLLHGLDNETGALLVQHPDTAAAAFTGSLKAGRQLFDIASARPRPIPVYAEMGSLNPVAILPGALEERWEAIVAGLSASITMGCGQFCTKPGLIFVIKGSFSTKFALSLADKLASAPSAPMLNERIRLEFEKGRRNIETLPNIRVLASGSCSGYADCSPSLFTIDSEDWRAKPALQEELFGPAAILVECSNRNDMLKTLRVLPGQLTGTLHIGKQDSEDSVRQVAQLLEARAGRIVFNGYPTGVEVSVAMVHGGLYPAATFPGATSVGTEAARRFVRPIAYQNMPDTLLPPALQEANPLGIRRLEDGRWLEPPQLILAERPR